MTTAAALTDTDRWDAYWRAVELPVEARDDREASTAAILSTIDRFAASDAPRSVLEIGGAPGGYLVHFWRRFNYQVCVLDSSAVGVEMTARNFQLLGVPGRVIHGDLFAPPEPRRRFDIVYSLGLIEHFADTAAVIAAHLEFVRPGGTLIVGCPNFRGLNLALLRWLSPSMLAWHNLEAMNVSRWPEFERSLGLEVQFRGYIGGFQPAAFWRCERDSIWARALRRALIEVGRWRNGSPGRELSRLNSRFWSYYCLAVYRKPPGNA